MSGPTNIEKHDLERILDMGGGGVLGFTNREFADFFRDEVAVPIYTPAYAAFGDSKAKRMRAFWQIAPDNQVAKTLHSLLKGWRVYARGNPLAAEDETILREIIARLDPRLAVRKAATPQACPAPCAAPTAAESARLRKELQRVAELAPHPRGFAFEKFLHDLFHAYGLGPRSSFRLVGEQIDGSFVLHQQTYLFEGKWENARTGADALHVFEGKLSQKADWARGLFVSIAGFSEDGLVAFGRTKKLVCVSGQDLDEMFRLGKSVTEVIDAKVRRAAESGSPYTPLREILG